MTDPSDEELAAAFCLEAVDQIARRPEMSTFRRRARLHQARWRVANGHPIGTQPIVPKPGDSKVRPVGSRVPLDYARETGANFLTPGALVAVRARSGFVEPRQSIDHQRLWADLLWSLTLSFNLFGDLAADLERADAAVHRWFPDVPGHVSEVRFAHSPGWFDPAYLNSLRSFNTAFVLDLGDGSRGVLAVEAMYHERNKPETPRTENLTRYRTVAERSKAFTPGAIDLLNQRSDLCVMWIEHLLVHSMLQHNDENWRWGKLVVVHPAANADVVDACGRYIKLLADGSSFATMTLEDLLATATMRRSTVAALRARYLFD